MKNYPNNVTVKKKNEDTWTVFYWGKELGEVYKGWTRHGGAGYTYTGTIYTFKTLKDAINDIHNRKVKK
jgi:hypothetical protein